MGRRQTRHEKYINTSLPESLNERLKQAAGRVDLSKTRLMTLALEKTVRDIEDGTADFKMRMTDHGLELYLA